MYSCNLSYKQAQLYMDLVISNRLLKVTPEGYYKTTPKGLDFLKSYQEIQAFLTTQLKNNRLVAVKAM